MIELRLPWFRKLQYPQTDHRQMQTRWLRSNPRKSHHQLNQIQWNPNLHREPEIGSNHRTVGGNDRKSGRTIPSRIGMVTCFHSTDASFASNIHRTTMDGIVTEGLAQQRQSPHRQQQHSRHRRQSPQLRRPHNQMIHRQHLW